MREFSNEDFVETLGLSLERFCVEDFGKRLGSRAWREIFYFLFSMEVFVETLLLSLNRISMEDFMERLSLQRSSMEDGVCGEIEFD